MKAIVLILSLVLITNFSFAASITYNTNPDLNFRNLVYQEINTNGFNLQWATTVDQKLNVIISSATTGWLAVGFGNTNAMQNANIIIGYVQSNTTHIRDDYGVSQTSHNSDLILGGADNITLINGTEQNGTTTLNFEIPLNSGDQYDKLMTIGNPISIILAKGSADNYSGMHTAVSVNSITIAAPTDNFLLNSFTADFQSNSVLLHWTTTYENNLLGYNIFQNTENNSSTSIKINPVIINANNTVQQSEYTFTDIEYSPNVPNYYWLQSVNLEGETLFSEPLVITPVAIADNVQSSVKDILYSNFPNPFNPSTQFSFYLNNDKNISLEIYNSRGQLVRTLFTGYLTKGLHREFLWNGQNDKGLNVGSGFYYFLLKSGNDRMGKKIILMK